jgi:divalent metal cation (Fe/Co/Zn/Cd) transporter
VALANFSYFFVEFSVARHIGSVSLFADSIDFLEDTSVNFLVLVALGWTLRRRASVGDGARAAVTGAGHRHGVDGVEQIPGTGAAGRTCLVGHRPRRAHRQRELRIRADARAQFRRQPLACRVPVARNDALANIAIIGAGVVTYFWASAWPDLIVGVGIFLLNLDAAREVFEAARREAVSSLVKV